MLGLPLSALANLILKPQLIIAAGRAAHIQPGLGLAAPVWFLALKVLIAPLVEEPLKVLPLLARPARKLAASRASALWAGFGLGVSFGLGEALYLAYAIGQAEAYNTLPWYAFTGYLSERLFSCFAHGVLTAVLVTGLQRQGRYTLGALLAAWGLHLLWNTPTALYSFGLIPLEVYNFGLLIPFFGLAVVFEQMRRAGREPNDGPDRTEVVYWRRQAAG
jgi:RsiW-degrading membrane proteinase PrsW (M82 family)